ncbi:GNAT family N-acetyltransferase [Azorhizophilus paspali]|uniref:GNAT family N-acetyltransferase n=1 Tax=Azorhizophilus paspali TaxID=69963 RepID=A0ABV6SPM0_AZOPA
MESLQRHDHVARTWRRMQQLGPAHSLHLLLVKTINCLALFKILRGILLLEVDPAFLDCPAGYTPGFLDEKRLRHFVGDPRSGLDDAFLDEALAKGDRCYAILDGETLAAYGWYSRLPTRIDPPDLLLGFDPEYVYMYKGLTDPRYRGRRLHAIGMNRALQCYREEGAKGIVSYVESTNGDSLKSCFRLGYRAFGSIYLLRLFGYDLRLCGPGCRRYRFALHDDEPMEGMSARKA